MKRAKKVLALLVAFVLVIGATVSATVAYLTDDESVSNTFTAGQVDITLDEKELDLDEDGNVQFDQDFNLVYTDGRTEEGQDYGTLFPGQTITKDPTIHLTPNTETTSPKYQDAYVAAIITVTDGAGDIEKVIGSGYENLLAINEVISGGLVKENDTQLASFYDLPNGNLPIYGTMGDYAVYQTADKANGTYVFYVFMDKIMSPGDEVVLFDTITVPTEWTNTEMAEFVELDISVEAFAVQTSGFENVYDAVTTAFPGKFNF